MIHLVLRISLLFKRLKSLTEYPAKTGIWQRLLLNPAELNFTLPGSCQIDAWRLKMFTTLL
jgi:hypothetical protein